MFGDISIIRDDEDITGIDVPKKNNIKSEPGKDKKLILQIMGDINITLVRSVAIVEWTQGLITDTIADSVIAILMSVDSAPASVKMSSRQCEHENEHDHDHDHTEEATDILEAQHELVWKTKQVVELFKEQFGDAFTVMLSKADDGGIENVKEDIIGMITMGKHSAKVNFSSLKVEECNSNPLKGRVESILSIGGDLVSTLC